MAAQTKIVVRLHTKETTDDCDILFDLENNMWVTYLHIGMQFLNPFRPTVHAANHVLDLPDIDHNDRRLYLQASHGHDTQETTTLHTQDEPFWALGRSTGEVRWLRAVASAADKERVGASKLRD